jgi:hypothetical protein
MFWPQSKIPRFITIQNNWQNYFMYLYFQCFWKQYRFKSRTTDHEGGGGYAEPLRCYLGLYCGKQTSLKYK